MSNKVIALQLIGIGPGEEGQVEYFSTNEKLIAAFLKGSHLSNGIVNLDDDAELTREEFIHQLIAEGSMTVRDDNDEEYSYTIYDNDLTVDKEEF